MAFEKILDYWHIIEFLSQDKFLKIIQILKRIK